MARKTSSRVRSDSSATRRVERRRTAGLRRRRAAPRLEALANLAHELRTPLQVLLGYLEILRDEWADGLESEPREMLERMNVSLHELSHTVDNIMEFVLGEAGDLRRVQEQISLSGMINDLTPALEAARTGKAVELKFDLNDAPPTLEVPRRPLRLILSNLVLNAIKYTDHGRVTVRISRTAGGRGVEIEVADTGTGIAPGLIKLASRPFAQLSHSNTRQHRGLGLGLAVVHRNAHALGATVEISSTPGHGSRFIVRIPGPGSSVERATGRRGNNRAAGHERSAVHALAPPPRRVREPDAVASAAFL